MFYTVSVLCLPCAFLVLILQERENRSYLSSLGPRRLSSAGDLEEKENRYSAHGGPAAALPLRTPSPQPALCRCFALQVDPPVWARFGPWLALCLWGLCPLESQALLVPRIGPVPW